GNRYPRQRPAWRLLAWLGLFLGLDPFPQAFDRFGGLAIGIRKDVRVPAHQLGGDCFDHVGKIEGALLLRHPGMEDDLQQEVAEFTLQRDEITTCDRVRDLIGFFDCVWSDSAKTLLEIPRAAAAWRPQGRHDLDQA